MKETRREAADLLLKDDVLSDLAEVANIAQFVSYDPRLKQRHARVFGYEADYLFDPIEAALSALLNAAVDGSVNVRSFTPDDPKSREFIYGLKTVDEVASAVRRLASKGLYTIINETVDVNDGGVSGVALGDLLEFAPGDTPRCVEKPGTVSLPRQMGLRLLDKVYHFRPRLSKYSRSQRVEFSIHPLKRGIEHDHTIVWELEDVGYIKNVADVRWPNRFSRFIGDKAFGLLVADMLGLPVPATTVFARSLPPFSFGTATGTGEMWIRTCPVEQDPGRYTTRRGWLDPFKLLADEDPEGTKIASILAQEGIEATYSGSLIVEQDGKVTIQGVQGYGDEFMLGRAGVEKLPEDVEDAVLQVYDEAASSLGPVRLEWVRDSETVWIVQLHRGTTATSGSTIYPGDAKNFHRFEVAEGIDALRTLITTVQGTEDGIVLVGNVGVTSHLGDLLRRAKIPSKIERASDV